MIATRLLLALANVTLLAAPAGAVTASGSGPEKVPLQARPFDPQQVRLLAGPARDAMERARRYLHDLESDRLLHNFRVMAGRPSSARPLGDWERPNCELRGHFVGHYLSACALMVAATGDQPLKVKAEAIVAELANCQKALGKSGYLSAFPESFFDRLEKGQPVWAPWYTLHKIMAGLLDMYTYCGDRQALEVLKGMAAWAKTRTDRLSDQQMAAVLNTEFGGSNEVFYNLYAVSGDPRHLQLAHRFDHEAVFAPLARGRDELKGLHANTNIPKIVGAARRYELTADARARDIADHFWHFVVHGRCYATGGTSNHEHWRTAPNVLARELGCENQECCCTYNMLKLTRHLFSWKADVEYADYYERALWNSVLGTQNPDDGMMMYFIPLGPGYWKRYNTPRNSFWCCTGTGVESFSKLGDSIYFHDERGLWVNLFLPSEVTWPEKGLKLRQETAFPAQQGTALTFHVQRPTELELRLRIPSWVGRPVRVAVNGEAAGGPGRPGTYLVLKRTWQDGDRVELPLPMSLHAEKMPDDPTVEAILYGPLVLAGRLGTQGLRPELFHADKQTRPYLDPVAGPYFVADGDDPADWIKPVAGKPLEFRTVGQAQNVTLIPLEQLFAERYGVYWRVVRKGSAEQRKIVADEALRKEMLEKYLDACLLGDEFSESAHHFHGFHCGSGQLNGRAWHDARDGGWFSWDLKVLPEGPMALSCSYWGGDGGRREFAILVDGKKVATQKLEHKQPGRYFDVRYPIPAELTRGKQKVTIKFQAAEGKIAGGVFGCAILKPEMQTSSKHRNQDVQSPPLSRKTIP